MRCHLCQTPRHCIPRRVMVVIDSRVQVWSNRPLRFVSVDFRFKICTASNQHQNVWYTPPTHFPNHCQLLSIMNRDFSRSTIESEVRQLQCQSSVLVGLRESISF